MLLLNAFKKVCILNLFHLRFGSVKKPAKIARFDLLFRLFFIYQNIELIFGLIAAQTLVNSNLNFFLTNLESVFRFCKSKFEQNFFPIDWFWDFIKIKQYKGYQSFVSCLIKCFFFENTIHNLGKNVKNYIFLNWAKITGQNVQAYLQYLQYLLVAN